MSTATEAPQQSFRDRIKGLKRKELVELAKEDFQLNIDARIDADILRDTLQRVYEERVASALEQNQAAAQVFLERDPNEKLLNVIFQPLDFPNNPLKFANDCGYGIRDRRNPTRNPKGLSKMPVFFLIPGQTYQLPICLINILSRKTMHDSKPEIDMETGMIAGNVPIIKPRFSFVTVLSEEEKQSMGKRSFN